MNGQWPRDSGEMFPGEQTLGTQMLRALIAESINDVTYQQMNRIVRALQRMSRSERDAPKRVAEVMAAELGPQKALEYLDKALAGGLIKASDYNQMRSVLILPLPREEIPGPIVARAAAELLETLAGAGRQALVKPFQDLDSDVKRIREAWGL